MTLVSCRKGCGACCIAPSITSFIPGMPRGKPAGVRCIQLTDDDLCALFGQPERPLICRSYRFNGEFCGTTKAEAMSLHANLEAITTAG